MTDRTFKLRSARREAILVAVIAGVLGLVLVAASSLMATGTPTSVLLTVGSVLLTLAIGGFVYEVVLRDIVTGETIELLGLKETVVSTGLREVQQDTATDWRSVLETASRFDVLVATPFGWLEQSWPHILNAGAARKIELVVHLPNPEAQAIPVLAERLGLKADELGAQLRDTERHLSASWDNAQLGHAPLRKGSLFSLKYYDFVPTFDLVITDSSAVIRLHALGQILPGDPAMCARFDASADAFPVPWLKEQFQRLEKLPASWEREVRGAGS